MIGGNKRATHLDSGCQSNGIAQRNGVLRFQAGSLGKNYLVNGVNKLNRHCINLFKNKAGLFFAQCAVEPIIHFNQIDGVHIDNGFPGQSFFHNHADFHGYSVDKMLRNMDEQGIDITLRTMTLFHEVCENPEGDFPRVRVIQ